ncbi:MAG: Type 1 glutamine amidotransferase-like domain-containing protein [Clostridia bacterium]|nr:Type 1 glutamine amidotransferase-like domain-containing protein [Clostridia bacterium]
MINILLEGYDIDAHRLYEELREYIKPDHRVVVVALSFRDNRVKGLSDWNALYKKGCGMYYDGIVGGFTAYGVSEENICFINYFTDTEKNTVDKIKNADIVYFLGGLPDRMTDRIKRLKLYDVLMRHNGIVMGYSAGAVTQFKEYHLSPDDDYKDFAYYEGLPYLSDFYLEVHYKGTPVQDESIRRVLAERGKPVYATAERAGAVIVDNGRLKLIGYVKVFGNRTRKACAKPNPTKNAF